ncbi:MAG: glycoside hydrolase family 2 protein, partial [Ardenticatenaceae bacterium]
SNVQAWTLDHSLVVRVEDLSRDVEQPRGKQYWEEQSSGIFYTRTTGIWQTVWLEPVALSHLSRLKLTPDIDGGQVVVEFSVVPRGNQPKGHPAPGQEVEIELSFEEEVVARERSPVRIGAHGRAPSPTIPLPDFVADPESRLWSPEHPALYEVVVRLVEDDSVLDEVKSYFGMRKVSIQDGQVKLNNQPYYMKLVLDQGYYPDGILTPPSDHAVRRDVELVKEMGFNGVRKHQKIADPRYLYWADRLGLLVWGEMANAHAFSDKVVRRIAAEWQEAVERDYNHPSIVAWVPLNESWGVPSLTTDPRQIHHALSLYHLTKSLDSTRPVISNDGWEHTRSDICSIHDYEPSKEILRARYQNASNVLAFKPGGRSIYVPGFEHQGEPFLITEFGGIAYRKDQTEGWGYSVAQSDEDFAARYQKVVSALRECPLIQGFCYTQFTDVEQEINGLLTYDRQPKIPLERIRAINEGK